MQLSTIIGVIVGGIIGFLSAAGAKWFDDYLARRALRAAFRAEIASLIRIAEVRRHVEVFGQLLNDWKAGNDRRPTLFGYEAGTPVDPVFSRNVDKIGMLGRHAADVTMFYMQLNAVRIALSALASGRIYDGTTIPQRVSFLEQNLNLWLETKPLAEKLIIEL